MQKRPCRKRPFRDSPAVKDLIRFARRRRSSLCCHGGLSLSSIYHFFMAFPLPPRLLLFNLGVSIRAFSGFFIPRAPNIREKAVSVSRNDLLPNFCLPSFVRSFGFTIFQKEKETLTDFYLLFVDRESAFESRVSKLMTFILKKASLFSRDGQASYIHTSYLYAIESCSWGTFSIHHIKKYSSLKKIKPKA